MVRELIRFCFDLIVVTLAQRLDEVLSGKELAICNKSLCGCDLRSDKIKKYIIWV